MRYFWVKSLNLKTEKKKNLAKSVKMAIVLFSITAVTLITFCFIVEIKSSIIQAHLLSKFSSGITFKLNKGESNPTIIAPNGPYDKRLGYTFLPAFSQILHENSFIIAQHTQVSDLMVELVQKGLYPIYREKTQAGLEIFDNHGETIFSLGNPKRIFTSFSEIPEEIIDILLFIENRNLLDENQPFFNPAIHWPRLVNAALEVGVHFVYPNQSFSGGSTLATQLEKFRHSEEGFTDSIKDKIIQMSSASIRAYLDGKNTVTARQRIVLDYINSVPLAALPNCGELIGLGDGLWAWYGTQLDYVKKVLNTKDSMNDATLITAKAVTLKQVLSLIIAARRPTDLLLNNRDLLKKKCNIYIELLFEEGIITEQLKHEMLKIPLHFRTNPPPISASNLVERKSSDCLRTKLLSLLDVNSLYTLDRFDLSVKSTIDLSTQIAVTEEIRKLHDPYWVKKNNFDGPGLLEKGDPKKIIYSFTLYEKTPRGNVIRVQTDSHDQPFNFNQDSKLNLGSTAKLRTLIHYLEIIASLYERYSIFDKKVLLKLKFAPEDKISRWAVSYLMQNDNKSLEKMLNAAMQRKYFANPNEIFFTGGGNHRFHNFNKKDDHRTISVLEGFRRSVNLVFIRLMRDIVNYHIYGTKSFSSEMLRLADHPKRKEYLLKFADLEGSVFIKKFYSKYIHNSSDQIFTRLHNTVRPSIDQMGAICRYVLPNIDIFHFQKFLQNKFPAADLSESAIKRLYNKYNPQSWSLADLAHIIRVHPLELWVATYLYNHPKASLNDVLKESQAPRQEAYRWLFQTSHKAAQDRRIYMVLEKEAFFEIHKEWKRLGYPFDELVPSYATSIGSSADRPDALAELLGIIINDGIHMPAYLIQELTFAANTPYELHFVREPPKAKRVLKVEIAQIVKEALFNVVEKGTAKRICRASLNHHGSELPVGGKTGTGDHRYKIVNRNGSVISSKVLNRTATFAFIIGDRFFGNITAYVPEPDAVDYSFTSSLPVAVLRSLVVHLQTMMNSSKVKEFT